MDHDWNDGFYWHKILSLFAGLISRHLNRICNATAFLRRTNTWRNYTDQWLLSLQINDAMVRYRDYITIEKKKRSVIMDVGVIFLKQPRKSIPTYDYRFNPQYKFYAILAHQRESSSKICRFRNTAIQLRAKYKHTHWHLQQHFMMFAFLPFHLCDWFQNLDFSVTGITQVTKLISSSKYYALFLIFEMVKI